MIGAQGGATLRQIDQLFGAGTVAGLSDAQLLERFLTRRDASAFEALVARHGPMVLTVCRGVLRDEHATEDAFQATFLILVRKAGAIRGRAALGGWLYRVAHRVAVQANAGARRRRERERQVGIMSVASGPDDRRDDDRAAVHEEVARLPERQRLPVMLCYLGGRTHAEAAAELRCGEATVRRRLANARERLRARLSRRGVAPAIVLRVASSSWRETVAVPSAWAATTTAAALRVTAGQAITAGVVSASVAAPALGALRASLVARLRIGGAALLSVAAVAALAAGVATRDDPRPISAPEPPAAAPPPGPKPARETGEELTIRGQVLGPSGLPVARAKISLWILEDYQEPDRDPVPCGESGPDGRFVFQAQRAVLTSSRRERLVQIVATADGFGPAWVRIMAGRVPDEMTLRLAEDFPIAGRVLDLEGRPAAGARVGLFRLTIPQGGPENYLSAVRNQGPEMKGTFPGEEDSWLGRLPGQPAFVGCDAKGSFWLAGLGRDRVVELVVQGAEISEGKATVLTRRMAPVVGPVSRRLMSDSPAPVTVYGAAFDYVASPSRTIVGVIRDRVTTAPLAGIRVISQRMPGKDVSGGERMPGAITDATGGYMLHGHPKAGSYIVAAVPEPGTPYLVGSSRVADTPGTGPLRADMELARGIPFRVRPVDAATGLPVAADVSYYPVYPNPHFSGSIGYGAAAMGPLSRARINPDGSYSGVALPGPGAICIENHQETYLPVKINAREFFKPGQPPTDAFVKKVGR